MLSSVSRLAASHHTGTFVSFGLEWRVLQMVHMRVVMIDTFAFFLRHSVHPARRLLHGCMTCQISHVESVLWPMRIKEWIC
jgi:hypothetical protein